MFDGSAGGAARALTEVDDALRGPRAGAGLTWRIIEDEPRSGARNMALDHALALGARQGAAVLRLYGWRRSTVSFGRNEPVVGRYLAKELRRKGIDCVRRPTGGRAVMHSRELTYCVVAPERAMGGPRQTYLKINQALVRGLVGLGIPARVSGARGTPSLDSGPCFSTPAAGEVVVGAAKIAGSAQARIEGALLQHGSLLVGNDQTVMNELGRSSGAGGSSTTLSEWMGEVDVGELTVPILEGFRSTFVGEWCVGSYTESELRDANWLEETRYARNDWTWRR